MLVEVCSCYLSLERGGIMLKETLLNIVDLNFDKNKPNVIIFDTIKNVYPDSDYKIKL